MGRLQGVEGIRRVSYIRFHHGGDGMLTVCVGQWLSLGGK